MKWGDIMRIMRALVIILITLVVGANLIPVFQTEHLSSHTEMIVGAPQDMDSDGDSVSDSEDLVDNGNAVLIFSIDYVRLDHDADVWTDGDPYFVVYFDLDNNGSYMEDEEWTSLYALDAYIVDDEGFEDRGSWWIELGIEEDQEYFDMWIFAYDSDDDEDDIIDINSQADLTYVNFTYWVSESNDNPDRYYTDGSEDEQSEIDAYIEFSFHLVKGVTIENYTPDISEITIYEGDELALLIDETYIPDYLDDMYFSYDWIIWNLQLDEWYYLNNTDYDNNTYDLFANYGSEGEYIIACVIYTPSSRYPYYYSDFIFWYIEIIHKNTIPVASITVDTANPDQFEDVHISGRNSFDIDGDELTFTWDFGDGSTGTGVDVVHTYSMHGDFNVKLTVEDDEGATDTKMTPLTINPIDISHAEHWSSISDGDEFYLNTQYQTYTIDRISGSVDVPLPLGYSLSLTSSFISELYIDHNGTAQYQFDVNEEKNEVEYSLSLLSTSDEYQVFYRPGLEFNISLIDSEGMEHDIWSVKTPIPLINTNEGLDADGEPFATIPVLGEGTIDVYTWDSFKLVYETDQVIYNNTVPISLDTLSIPIAQVDILQFLKVFTGGIPIVGTAVDIIDFFANMYLECNLDVDTVVNERLGFLIHSTGETDLSEDFIWCDDLDSASTLKVSGATTESKFYAIMKTHSEANITVGLDFIFNLTDHGKTVYGVWTTLNEKGLILGVLDILIGVVDTGSLPSEDYSIRRTLWESEEIQSIEDSSIYYWDFLNHSHEFQNTAPSVTLMTPSKAEFKDNKSIILEWSSADADDDSLTYTLYLDQDNNPKTPIAENITAMNYNTSGLEPGKYYWKIVASDGETQTESDIYSFSISEKDDTSGSGSSTPGFELISVSIAICLILAIRKRRLR